MTGAMGRNGCSPSAAAPARTLVGLVAGVVLLLGVPPPASTQEAEPDRTAYVANGCYQCHGYDGQGGAAGPRIAPSPYPFEAFAALVRRPGSVMPAYPASILGDRELRTIYAYVRAIAEPPPVTGIELLR